MNKTNAATLPIHVTPHHLELSPALSEFLRDKLAKIPRVASDVLATDVVLRRHHGTSNGKRFTASARLSLAGRDIHAAATHADLYTAIVKLVSRLGRCSRKRKTRREKTRAERRPSSRGPQVAVSRVEAQDESTLELKRHEGREPAGRNGGQEQRVFGFRRTSPFAFRKISPSRPEATPL